MAAINNYSLDTEFDELLCFLADSPSQFPTDKWTSPRPSTNQMTVWTNSRLDSSNDIPPLSVASQLTSTPYDSRDHRAGINGQFQWTVPDISAIIQTSFSTSSSDLNQRIPYQKSPRPEKLQSDYQQSLPRHQSNLPDYQLANHQPPRHQLFSSPSSSGISDILPMSDSTTSAHMASSTSFSPLNYDKMTSSSSSSALPSSSSESASFESLLSSTDSDTSSSCAERIVKKVRRRCPVKLVNNVYVAKNKHLEASAKNALNEWYQQHQEHPYPSDEQKQHLAHKAAISVEQVTSWFANKRNRSQNTKPQTKKRKMEQQLLDLCAELKRPEKRVSVDVDFIVKNLMKIINDGK